MNTAIDIEATKQTDTQLLAKVEPPLPAAITSESQSYESLMALAKELCTTGFLPPAVKTPAQACAIILTGRELGLGPMQSLRSICIIQGKPELAADLQLSIFHRDGGRSKWLALTEEKAVLWLRHPNGDEHTETFAMLDAKRAGLAGGQNWQKYPKAMLRSRAITAGLKSIGFEPLAGAYAPGEIGGPEIVGPEPETVQESPNDAKSRHPSEERNSQKGESSGKGPRSSSGSSPAANRAPTGASKPPAASPQQPPPESKAVTPAKAPQFATDKTRDWLIGLLTNQGFLDLFEEFARKLTNPTWLMTNEKAQDLPLQFVPASGEQYRLLKAALTDFGNGGEAVAPYAPNPVSQAEKTKQEAKAKVNKGEKPPSPSVQAAKAKDEGWFWNVICPIPNKGQKKADYDRAPETILTLYTRMKSGDEAARKRLWGFARNWTPEPREYQGKVYQPSEADLAFREALDAFCDWEEKHGNDTKGHPAGPQPKDAADQAAQAESEAEAAAAADPGPTQHEAEGQPEFQDNDVPF